LLVTVQKANMWFNNIFELLTLQENFESDCIAEQLTELRSRQL